MLSRQRVRERMSTWKMAREGTAEWAVAEKGRDRDRSGIAVV
jgi:hypothetical protein